MKVIQLSKGMAAIIDDSDFLELAQYRWCFDGRYAVRRKRFADGKPRKIYMRREIIGPILKGFEIDHINRQALDNRRENLRVCTNSENAKNKGRQKSNKSGYRGVHFSKVNKNWVAQISVNNKINHIGSFKTAEDAAAAYNTAALRLHGEFANPN